MTDPVPFAQQAVFLLGWVSFAGFAMLTVLRWLFHMLWGVADASI